MQTIKTIAALRQTRAALRGPIALVPTMGALHAGHLSLVAAARASAETVIATIFVNPLQFGPNEDFARYPRQLETDLALLEAAGVDLVFTPSAAEMYPDGASTTIEVGEIGERLDGAHRPGHFRGVATVVAKLFHLTQPDLAFFGQKDAVQVAVLRRMVRDLNFPLELIACPIVRDPDGLALSSRNAYLSPGERQSALVLSRSLRQIQVQLQQGIRDLPSLLGPAQNLLHDEPGVRLEYLEAVHPDTLLPVDEVGEVAAGTLIALAVHIGKTRLIDNVIC